MSLFPHALRGGDPQLVTNAVACAMGQVLDLRDLGTGLHSTQIVELALAVGAHFGLEHQQLHDLEVGATLHDLGKVGIPDTILRKDGALTAEEREVMQRHPEYGWAILRQVPGFARIALYILHHHERWDGSGYPGQLQGDSIPFSSRILAVVDAFHAMVSDRPYRRGLPVEEACRRLEAAQGTQFDPGVVAVFAQYARQQFGG